MKRIFVLALSILMLLSLLACRKQDKHKPQLNNMAIFQGASSYAYFCTDKEIIQELYNYVTSLEYEKITTEQANTDRDFLTQFFIHFVHGEKDILRFHIDKNGILWFETYENGVLDESRNTPDIQYYKITGEYSYSYIEAIYRNENPGEAVMNNLSEDIELDNFPEEVEYQTFDDIPYGLIEWDDYSFVFPKPQATHFKMVADGSKSIYSNPPRKDKST